MSVIKSEAQILADSMGVSLADFMCLANSVLLSINADKVEIRQVSTELVEAYIPVAVRKFDSFVAAYLTRSDVRSAVQIEVLELLAA
jgi:hypothetical protein